MTSTQLGRVLAAAGAIALAALGSEPASAAPKVVVETFTGPTAADVRGAVIRALSGQSEIDLVSTSSLLDAARRAGVDLETPAGREETTDRMGVAATVGGQVLREGGRWAARIEVTYRATGRVAERFSAQAASIRGLDDAVAKRLWRAVGPTLAAAPIPRRRRTVMLLSETGPKGGLSQVRDALRRAPWLTVVPADDVEAEPAALAALARARDLDGFLEVDLERRRRRWQAVVTVIGPDGDRRETVRAEAPRSRQIGAKIIEPLADALLALEPEPPAPAAPPPPPPLAANRARPDPAGPKSVMPRPEPGPTAPGQALELGASFRVMGRNLSYNDDLFGGLRPYDLAGAPVVRLEAGWYPGAYVSDGPLSWFGLEVLGDLALGLSTRDAAGRSFGSSAFALIGALRGRLPLGQHEVGLSVGAGLDAFLLDAADDGTEPDVPSAEYSFARFAVDGRFAITDDLALRAALGWRQVLSLGEVSDPEWFPNASAAGVDARLRVGYRLFEGFEAQVGAELRRYFSSFEPVPGDFPVAGGSIDQLWSIALGATYRL